MDCPLSALEERRDKDLVTVGGIITEAKRIRTRNGDPMMFATLDDLAGSVELLVFGNALADHEQALRVDQVVLVKGRVDHKEAGSTCLIVQSVEPYAPDQQELDRARARAKATAAANAAGAKPLHLSVSADSLSAETLAELQAGDRGVSGAGRGGARHPHELAERGGCDSAAPSACATRSRCGPTSRARSACMPRGRHRLSA